jgi:outer membrane protein assembly factor BamB
MKSSLFLSAALLLTALTLHAEDWPGFRGPTRQGHSSETALPLEWTAEKHIAWKTEIPGEGWSSPIVSGDRVFLSTTTDAGASCHVLALDRKDGRILWNTEVFRQVPGHKQSENSHATPTPVTDGEKVFAVFSDGSFAAVNLDGAIAWTNRDFKHYSQHGLAASPLLHGDLIIMPFDGSSRGPDTKIGWQVPWDQAAILALDKRTGQQRWRATRGLSRIAHVSPVIVPVEGRDQLISCAGDAIQGFDPKTGERLWSIYSEGEGVVPSPAFGDGLIFTASGFGKPTLRTVRPVRPTSPSSPSSPSSPISPISPSATGANATGGTASASIAWEQRKGSPSQSSLLYVKPHLYSVGEGGIATCYRADTGDIVWQERIGGAFNSSPVLADGRIYLLSAQGETTVLAPGAEFKVLAKNPLDEKCQASMAVSQKHLFIRTEKHLFAIGE